jgi:hypothetical protein
MAAREEERSHRWEVVELAVLRGNHGSVLVREWLSPAFDVDDAQAGRTNSESLTRHDV